MKLILIKWVDSVQPVPGWHFLDDAPENEITECQSVGWLVAENDVSVMIAQSVGDVGDDSRPRAAGSCGSRRPASASGASSGGADLLFAFSSCFVL